jgi:hypothetical protein
VASSHAEDLLGKIGKAGMGTRYERNATTKLLSVYRTCACDSGAPRCTEDFLGQYCQTSEGTDMSDRFYDHAIPVSFEFGLADVPANATTDLQTRLGGAGFFVPTGLDFYPAVGFVTSNSDLTAGTLTAKVTSNGTALVGGPEPALSDTVQRHSASISPLSPKVAAGAYVGAEVVTSATYAPTTADIDVVVCGYLVPSA